MFTEPEAKKVLEHFCSFPLTSSIDVLNEFAKLPEAIPCFHGNKNNFVYIPGTRADRVILVAHADTVWDSEYGSDGDIVQKLKFEKGIYSGTNTCYGIGADDRAGCAMLWLLKDSGHSLLVTDGEERGQFAANYIRSTIPELFEEINNHCYAIQFDRRGRNDYKTYNLPISQEFIDFIKGKTKYIDAGRNARTDIVALCDKICGVNLSIGYYNEHSASEILVFKEWLHTLNMVSELLKEEQKQYPLLSFKDDLL
jgi:hypothetical protein